MKAIVLGSLSGAAVLCAGLSLGGFAGLITAILFLDDDHRPDALSQIAPAAVFVLSLIASSLASVRFGWAVGRDWNRRGC